ncbi:hypothetical protein [Acinetobacter sp. ANC 3813]|uniref:hypothetical protein n=1 Tax=Acinetobacter sp. ANC 3813 TaxID=1977873 RepID=UPI000A35B673|nr:hypothetical protein [Acinetobacter sp. ANC 3813]OTG87833.1 hypothetical protein B9T34_15975 [Acinetobacter sp. ANC 3813]
MNIEQNQDLANEPKFRELVQKLALENGFKLKAQEDGREDLNEYVYQFAAALIDNQWIDASEPPELYEQEDGSNDISREIIFKTRYEGGIHHGWYMRREVAEPSNPCECCGEWECENDNEREPEYEYVFVANYGDEVFDEDTVECYAFLPHLKGAEA